MDTISLGLRRKRGPRLRSSLLALVRFWLVQARSRRQLRLMLSDPRALADLGLTREQAERESIRPFWC